MPESKHILFFRQLSLSDFIQQYLQSLNGNLYIDSKIDSIEIKLSSFLAFKLH